MKKDFTKGRFAVIFVAIAMAALLGAGVYLAGNNWKDSGPNDNAVVLPQVIDGTPEPAHCIGEGESFSDTDGIKCCDDLVQLPSLGVTFQCPPNADCGLTEGVCAKCGNGECGKGEDAANCSRDCATVPCIGDDGMDHLSDGKKGCCTGFVKMIRPGYGPGEYFSCEEDPSETDCGNGSCENGETVANCVSDCDSAGRSKCTATGGTWGYTITSCIPYSKADRIDSISPSLRIPGTKVCKDISYGTGCICDSSKYWASNEEGCLGYEFKSCGNGACNAGETEENCPSDCGVAALCTKENKSAKSLDPALGCCSGLRLNWIAAADGWVYTCQVCGNGTCDTGETVDNCAADCSPFFKEVKSKCIGTGGSWSCQESCGICIPKTKDQRIAGGYKCALGCPSGTVSCECACGEEKFWGSWEEGCIADIPVCGDGICEKGETENSCEADCYHGVVEKKPIIYLYPEKRENVNVKIDLAGALTADYPNYDSVTGWNVTAYPDGHLINLADGKEYSYLFWEGSDYGADYDMTKGFAVKGTDTKEFLQQTLARIGLNPKEYNEFIVYWYPRMKDNPYNIIHFAAEEYTSRAKLTITPEPESLLRVFMVFKPSQTKVEVMPQRFEPFERKGFTVVEWGGSEIR